MSAPSTPVDPAAWLAAGRELVSMSFSTMSEVRHQADLMVFGVFDDSLDALEAVLALHGREVYDPDCPAICAVCNERDDDWPCPTYQAIARALGVGEQG